jgi:rare lipoprotein A
MQIVLALLVAALLAGCGSAPKRSGGYYQDDGPGASPPRNVDKVEDAEPRVEPLNRGANNPYTVFGHQYVPAKSLREFKQRGIASWYGKKFHGQRTSNGERYDMYAMTAAHPTLPIPSYVRVTNLKNGKSVIVRVNDRGPFHPGRIIDLSYAAAAKLGYVNAGSTMVEIESILPEDMPKIAAQRRAPRVPEAQPAAPVAVAETRSQPPAPVVASAPAAPLVAIKPAIPTLASASSATPASALASDENPEARDADAVAALAVDSSAPPPEAQPIPLTSEASGIYLQLGAFSTRENAEGMRSRLQQQLAWLNQNIEILHEGALFRLHLGPYRDRSEASDVAARIVSAFELKPVIVVR